MLDSSDALGTALPDLEYWLCGGEEMSSELAARFAGAVPDGVLLNMYGFSESSADVAVYDTRDGVAQHGAVPIGRPIWNTRVYLLGAHGELVPPGAIGEIWVGGDGLAQGYLGRPGLTAEKFVPDPFSAESERLYRSGDLGRWRPDGVLEYLGRDDRQAKVRGHRIELAEIDHVLAQHEAVAACAAVAQRDRHGESRLAGFVVLRPNTTATVTELRAFLRDRLPDHMVPQMLHAQEKLPLQPNGKVDYRALSALVAEQQRGISRSSRRRVPRSRPLRPSGRRFSRSIASAARMASSSSAATRCSVSGCWHASPRSSARDCDWVSCSRKISAKSQRCAIAWRLDRGSGAACCLGWASAGAPIRGGRMTPADSGRGRIAF